MANPIAPTTTSIDPYNCLYDAQQAGRQAVKDSFIPYSTQYYANSEGLKKCALVTYVHTRNFVCHVVNFTSYVYDCIVEIVKFIAKGLIAFDKNYIGIANTSFVQWIGRNVYPINKVNGRRHLIIMPDLIERAIGELAYFSITSSVPRCHRNFQSDNSSMQEGVNQVVKSIRESETNRLAFNNPEHFDAKVINDGQENAFAVPGGKMAVSKLLAEKIDALMGGASGTKQVPNSVIQLADGTEVTVNLSDVGRDDVLAALLGHEMKHVASRDSIVRMGFSLVLNIVLCIARHILTSLSAKGDDKDDQTNQNKSHKGNFDIGFISSMTSWLSDQVEHINLSLKSQQDEYEADSTGMFFAKNANYNPLGAIALQEILKSDLEIADLYHKYFEFSLTHPHSNHRLVSLLAAYEELEGADKFNKSITVDISKRFDYVDSNSSNPAVKWAMGFTERFTKNKSA